MRPEVAAGLEALVGPLVAQGLTLGIAEGIAKVRGFDEGTYPGEACDRCGTVQALLMPWGPTRDFPSEPRQGLCDRCSSKEALWRQGERVRLRLDRDAVRESQDLGAEDLRKAGLA